MTSLDQANAVKRLEAEGWKLAENSGLGSVLGAAVQMVRTTDGVEHHILVFPNGSHLTEEMK
jgi:hypothetical protein